MKNPLDNLIFSNSFAQLPSDFYSRVIPTPQLVNINYDVAGLLGVSELNMGQAELAELFTGKNLPSKALPIAMLYSGHQFGQYVSQLGDGRAIMLGENKSTNNAAFVDQFIDRDGVTKWLEQYEQILNKEGVNNEARSDEMKVVNPKYILRNYMAQVAIEKVELHGNYNGIEKLMAVLKKPFNEHPEHKHYAERPPEWANSIEVSCSS